MCVKEKQSIMDKFKSESESKQLTDNTNIAKDSIYNKDNQIMK